MNVTLVSLDALLLKATHESLPCPDAPALEAFCTVMRDAAEGPQLAAQALSARIHTQNAREALLTLATVDRCMRKCGPSFHAEIGKFRFLNEMIKLVSPKYFASRTAPEVQTKVLQLLHAWSIEYPKESKFKVAYEMLKNQGVVKMTPPPLPPEDVVVSPRSKSAIFEDEEKSKLLQKLLQSKKPEDLQHANRLIKSMVREEERRSEASSRRALEVSAALDSAGLLRDMLRRARRASADERQLIRELSARCAQLRAQLRRAAQAEADDEALEDILSSIDLLDEVGELYKTCMTDNDNDTKEEPVKTPTNSESLLDFAGASGDGDKGKEVKSQAIEELGDIFSAKDGPSNIAEPLKPVNLMSNGKDHGDADFLGEKASKSEGWNKLDSLGAELLKKSLPDNCKRLDNFNSKPGKKLTMNELEKSSPKHNEGPMNGSEFDLDFFTKKPEKVMTTAAQVPLSPNDDLMAEEESESSAADEEADPDAVTWVVYFWQGRRAPNMGWLTFTFGLERKFKQLCKRLDVVRTHQQQESLKFMSHFHRQFVIRDGKRGAPPEGGKQNVELFELRSNGSALCTRLVQVKPDASQLNSAFCYILNVPLEGANSASSAIVYAWIGARAAADCARLVEQVAETKFNDPWVSLQVLTEGNEPENFFWVALGGRKEYDTDADFLNYTRLFRCSNEKGYFTVSEKCTDFCQDDLADDDIMILDNGEQVFLWLGAKCSEVEIKLAYKSAQVYIQHMKTVQPERPRKLFLTLKNKESRRFTRCFHGWGEHKRPPE